MNFQFCWAMGTAPSSRPRLSRLTPDQRVAMGDFNGDGHLDLAVTNAGGPGANPNTVAILLGTGTGDFSATKFIPVAEGPFGEALCFQADDGIRDVVVTNSGTDQVS